MADDRVTYVVSFRLEQIAQWKAMPPGVPNLILLAEFEDAELEVSNSTWFVRIPPRDAERFVVAMASAKWRVASAVPLKQGFPRFDKGLVWRTSGGRQCAAESVEFWSKIVCAAVDGLLVRGVVGRKSDYAERRRIADMKFNFEAFMRDLADWVRSDGER